MCKVKDNVLESVSVCRRIPLLNYIGNSVLTIGLPRINDVSEMAELLHVTPKYLWGLYASVDKEYYTKKVPKKHSGFRTIEAPSVRLKGIQAWILRNILDKVVSSPYSTAYRKGCSIVGNVNPHQNGIFFLSFDLKDFFPSIHERRIVGIFKVFGYNDSISKFLAHLCTFRGHLPQGAVTSPALSNIAAYHLDWRLGGYAGKKKFAYTRYADDITFSSGNRNVLSSSRRFIEKIIKSEKFTCNGEKTHFSGPGARCCVTGLVKNNSAQGFSVGKQKKNHMRSVIFNLIVNNRIIDSHYQNMYSVKCWLDYVKMIDNGKDCSYLLNYIHRLETLKEESSRHHK